MAKGHRRSIFYLSREGLKLAEKIRELLPDAEALRFKKNVLKELWPEADSLIFITASGIAIRAVAPFIEDKKEDPAVVLVDEKGRYAVSLLSGHLGGANRLAKEIARHLGGVPIITTATDLNGLTAIDLFAMENGLYIENPELLSKTSKDHLKRKKLRIYSDTMLCLPDDYEPVLTQKAKVIISNRLYPYKALYLRPGNLVLGIGLNSGTGQEEIEEGVRAILEENGLAFNSIKLIATHEKKLSEPGLKEFAGKYDFPLKGFSPKDLNSVKGIKKSNAAAKALGVQGVAEPSAIFAAGGGPLLLSKVKRGNLTLAIAESNEKTLYVVGTGPGGLAHITPKAISAIRKSQIIVGYKPYVARIAPLLKDKEVLGTGMTEEVDRARAATELAQKGKKVCVVSGGDPGIYGMAGLVLELAAGKGLHVEVIPGIPALSACAASLGAPLMHDFASISLSDRLTPWEIIEERLDAAARADFVIVLYNPKSRGRVRQIERAREIIMQYRAGNTPVGIVRAATRDNEHVAIATLEDMLKREIDMQSTVIIGNSNTRRLGVRLVTPRGYERKYRI
jgi:cobalt-precorrin 5A hydrolase/precorrin-3B C17-methyltransferase